MHLQESGEMYLETIYILSKKIGSVRSLDVAEYMNFSKPSVSRAVGLLKSGDYILVDGSGYITLTDSGREIAEKCTSAIRFSPSCSKSSGSIRRPPLRMPAR